MPGKVLGLSFDSSEIIGVELGHRLGEVWLENIWEKSLKSNAYEQIFGLAPPLDEEDYTQVLKELELEAREVALAIPSQMLFYHELEFPFSDLRKIRQVVPLEAEGYFPFSISNHLLEYPQPAIYDHSSQILLFALEREKFSQLLSRLEDFNLDPAFFTPEGMSLALLSPPSVYQLWLLVKAKNSILLGVGENLVLLYRRIPLGYQELIDSLDEQARAEIFSQAQHSSEAEKKLEQWMNHLAQLITQSLRWQERFRKSLPLPPKFEELILAGKYPAGLKEKLKDKLESEIEEFQIPDWIRAEQEIPSSKHPQLAEALSLALCRVKREAKRLVNFRKGEFAWRAEYQIPYQKFIFPALILVLVLILGLVRASSERSLYQEQEKALKKQMAQAYQRVFPGSIPTDPVRQLAQAYQSAQSKLEAYRSLLYPSALEVLSAISEKVPEDVEIIISKFNYSGNKVRIEGETDEFASTKEFVDQLSQVEFFKKVNLEDTRSTPRGAVKFSIQIELNNPGEKINE